MSIFTGAAAQGFDWHSRHGAQSPNDPRACPYLNATAAAMAWHLGRHLAATGDKRPTPEAAIRDQTRAAVTMGRTGIFVVRGRCDILIGRFIWRNDNTFTELR